MIEKKSCDQSIIINIYINKDYKASLQETLILSSTLVKKANRWLYVLRQLKKCKVPSTDIVHIYCMLMRSILESASAVFAGLFKYLACYLENMQKRALSPFGLVFRMKQHMTKLHYSLFLTVGQSCVLNL